MPTDRRNRNPQIGFYKSLYLSNRFFLSIAFLLLLSIICFIFPQLLFLFQLAGLLFALLVVIDFITLYRKSFTITGTREIPNRLSNGDENEIIIHLKSLYPFPIYAEIIEEIPFQFQERNLSFSSIIASRENKKISYNLRPTERGVYRFGHINIFVQSKLSLLKRRFTEGEEQTIDTYPSFLNLSHYNLLLNSNQLTTAGIKQTRRLGNATEFEHIKPYVIGDDPRTINYKATARANELMVNTFMEERAQSVYCLIDKGRTMQMPFEGLSLLDYAINSSLLVANTALIKGDKAGIITFSNTIDHILPASDRRVQRSRILETLYKQQTDYKESNYAELFTTVKRTIKQRSLLILYTNFETLNSLKRQLNYLRLLSKDHLLIIAFFLNTAMEEAMNEPAENVEDFFRKSMAEKMHSDKRLVTKELNRYGIHSILTVPEKLSIQSINKYLEIKTRGLI